MPAVSTAPLRSPCDGSTGYYCAGMNKQATFIIVGSAGPGVAENMMSGTVVIEGDASQYAGATGHGGLLVIEGNASSRCGISMKGIDIVVHGNVGHMCAFMAQAGNLVVLGDAGDALGDSLYEARLFVRGTVKSLRRGLHREGDAARASRAFWPTCWSAPGADAMDRKSSSATARRASSINFNIDNAAAYWSDHEQDDQGISGTPRTVPRKSATFDDLHCGNPPRRGDRHLRHPRRRRQAPGAAFRRPAVSRRVDVAAIRWKAIARSCDTEVVLGTRFAKKPIELEIPITIAGMSFGSLSGPGQGSARARRDRRRAPRPPPATAA